MTKIPYANENRSKFIPLIKDQLVDFNGNIEISIKDIKGRGYPGKFLIDISPNDDFFVVADFQNKDKTISHQIDVFISVFCCIGDHIWQKHCLSFINT